VYEQIYQPVAGSLVLSTVVAAIPILVLFVLLAGLRVAAQWGLPDHPGGGASYSGIGLPDADRPGA
jgi:hypothetical protein